MDDEPVTQAATTTFWQTAYEAHAPAVLAFLGRRLPSRDEAEDLLQETFVRCIRAGNAREEQLRYYLLTTARHLLVNRLRRPRLVVPADELAARRGGSADDLADPNRALEDYADPAVSPERDAAWSAFKDGLERAVAGLSADLRLAFQLGVVERHPYADVMRLTGWSLPQVKTNVFRARQRVIAALGDRLEDAVWSHGS